MLLEKGLRGTHLSHMTGKISWKRWCHLQLLGWVKLPVPKSCREQRTVRKWHSKRRRHCQQSPEVGLHLLREEQGKALWAQNDRKFSGWKGWLSPHLMKILGCQLGGFHRDSWELEKAFHIQLMRFYDPPSRKWCLEGWLTDKTA